MTVAAPSIELSPRLVVSQAERALEFYQEVFGAELFERFVSPDGCVVHAALRLGTAVFSVTEQTEEQSPLSQPTVLLHLTVHNPDDVAARFVRKGGEILIDLEDRSYGKREGRFRDPFGQVWILSCPVEDLSEEEIQRRLDNPQV